MAKKRCSSCGRFMALTDLLPDEDEFDYELAYECGLLPEQEYEAIFDTKGYWSRFRYVQDLWECGNCHTQEWHTEGKKYYYDPDVNFFNGEKPLTPREIAQKEREAQEAAGQSRLAFRD